MGVQFGSPKIVKNLDFGKQAKDKLIKGIDKLSEAVATTLGASGRTVVLEDDFGNPHVTKDGVTVANYINLEDPIENLGVNMLRQASRQTATKAGDGTTTSTVLAQSIIKNYFELKGDEFSFRDIRSGMEKFVKHVVNFLNKKALPVDDKRLSQVSTISCNNDKVCSAFIAPRLLIAASAVVFVEATSFEVFKSSNC